MKDKPAEAPEIPLPLMLTATEVALLQKFLPQGFALAEEAKLTVLRTRPVQKLSIEVQERSPEVWERAEASDRKVRPMEPETITQIGEPPREKTEADPVVVEMWQEIRKSPLLASPQPPLTTETVQKIEAEVSRGALSSPDRLAEEILRLLEETKAKEPSNNDLVGQFAHFVRKTVGKRKLKDGNNDYFAKEMEKLGRVLRGMGRRSKIQSKLGHRTDHAELDKSSREDKILEIGRAFSVLPPALIWKQLALVPTEEADKDLNQLSDHVLRQLYNSCAVALYEVDPHSPNLKPSHHSQAAVLQRLPSKRVKEGQATGPNPSEDRRADRRNDEAQSIVSFLSDICP